MINKKTGQPLSEYSGGGMERKKSLLTRGMSRLAEPIDELVESVEAGVTG